MLLKMIPKRFLASAFACALIFVTSGCSTATTQEAQAAAAPAIQPAQVTRGTVAATGGADRIVSRRTGRPSSGSFHLPDRDCRSEPLAATKLQSEGRTIGQRGG